MITDPLPPAGGIPGAPDGTEKVLPAVPEIVHVQASLPTAEAGSSTTEFKITVVWSGVISTATGVFDAVVVAGTVHIDPAIVTAVNLFSAAVVSLLVNGYGRNRSIRKAGTQG